MKLPQILPCSKNPAFSLLREWSWWEEYVAASSISLTNWKACGNYKMPSEHWRVITIPGEEVGNWDSVMMPSLNFHCLSVDMRISSLKSYLANCFILYTWPNGMYSSSIYSGPKCPGGGIVLFLLVQGSKSLIHQLRNLGFVLQSLWFQGHQYWQKCPWKVDKCRICMSCMGWAPSDRLKALQYPKE